LYDPKHPGMGIANALAIWGNSATQLWYIFHWQRSTRIWPPCL
jgi:hypothetical protein